MKLNPANLVNSKMSNFFPHTVDHARSWIYSWVALVAVTREKVIKFKFLKKRLFEGGNSSLERWQYLLTILGSNPAAPRLRPPPHGEGGTIEFLLIIENVLCPVY
jgi:hypothetical protein